MSGPREIQSLVAALDENPDILHTDLTPAVLALIELGTAGGEAVVELLDAPGRPTRVHAQRVLEGVLMQANGWRSGQGYGAEDGQRQTDDVLAEVAYDPDAEPAERRAAIGRWRQWLAGRAGR